MIVDSSALIAILRAEQSAKLCAEALEQHNVCRISAANFLEVAIVIDASGDPIASRRVDEMIRLANILIEPVTEAQARLAREAYKDFGKGSGHPAQLNFGDCFAYALAQDKGEPLLYTGRDFTHTDIASVL
ncbi:MAG TPA: type II toxin-antitoxin system VapC family toxin [Candidatus Obscuribacterales bacterium]